MNRISGSLLILLALASWSVGGRAQEKKTLPANPSAPQARDCPEAKSTRLAEECFGKLSGETNAAMKAKVQQVAKVVAGNEKASPEFAEAQQTWEKYRDQSCAQIWEFWNPGTIKNYESSRCEVVLNRERVKFLDDMYHVPLHH